MNNLKIRLIETLLIVVICTCGYSIAHTEYPKNVYDNVYPVGSIEWFARHHEAVTGVDVYLEGYEKRFLEVEERLLKHPEDPELRQWRNDLLNLHEQFTAQRKIAVRQYNDEAKKKDPSFFAAVSLPASVQ